MRPPLPPRAPPARRLPPAGRPCRRVAPSRACGPWPRPLLDAGFRAGCRCGALHPSPRESRSQCLTIPGHPGSPRARRGGQYARAVTPEQLQDVVRTAVARGRRPGDLAVAVPGEVVVERPKNPRARRLRHQRRAAAGQAGRPAAAGGGRAARRPAARRRPASSAVDVAGPGFLNITLAQGALGPIAVARSSTAGRGVRAHRRRWPGSGSTWSSSRPTRPARCTSAARRWAAVGDALARVLEAAGADVTREYYFNDAGVQIDRFAASLLAAANGRADARRTATAAPTSTRSPPQVVAAEPRRARRGPTTRQR